MAIEPSGCSHCHELEAKLRRAEAKLDEILTRVDVGMANGRLLQESLLGYFSPPPEEKELRAV